MWDPDFATFVFPSLLRGLGVTVEITLIGSAIALVLGLIVAVLRNLRIPVLRQVLWFYVEFIRGTPVLVQAYFAFFVMPKLGVSIDPLQTGIIVMGVNYSAYMAEVYRAGIESVPKGQWEAVRALSLPGSRAWRRIIIPQAVPPIVPALGNYIIQMFKDSAILSAITVTEMMSRALSAGSSYYRYIEPLTIAGLLFLVVSYLSSILVRRLEKRLVINK